MVSALTLPVRADETSQTAYLNGGYYLLNRLCQNEARLSWLFLFKDAPQEVESYGGRISKTAKETLATLEQFQARDAQVKLEANPLPAVEQDVRDAIQGEKQHQLIFGTSGPEFVRALLVDQVEASGYASHLASSLAQHETDPKKAKALQDLSAQWQAINQEAFRLLRSQ